MRLVFCGTPAFAVPTLQALRSAGHSIELVLSQPDRPSGRGLALTVPPVKQAALDAGIEVLQPEKIRNNAELQIAPRSDPAGRDHRGRLRTDDSALDAGPAALRQPEPAWLAVAEVSRRRADPVGGGERGDGHRRDHDAAGRGHGHRRTCCCGANCRSVPRILRRIFFRVWLRWVRR